MAAGWMLVDTVLQAQLQAYLTSLTGSSSWTVHLFKNNYTPQPGDTVAEYTEADFLGYAAVAILLSGWGSVTVTSHVAISTYTTPCTFTASPSATAQTIYGYYITDSSANLVLAESFATPVLINPTDAELITPVLRHTIYPD